MEQGKEEDTLGQIIAGRHDAFRGTKELAQMGKLWVPPSLEHTSSLEESVTAE